MKKSLILPVLLCVLLGGCKTKDNLTYFRTNTPTAEQVITKANWQLKVEPSDELSIIVSSDMPTVTDQFNLPNNQGDNKAYLVDNQGYITLPKIGRLHVAGLTTSQIAEEVTRRVSEYAEAPLVRVELLNFKVNVLGEVRNPHVVKVPGERCTILEAITQAGDLTVFGRRENVTLIREENGEISYHRLDLTDGNIFNSPYYYLQQNDVIYVEPTEVRKAQAEYSVNDSYKIQVVSTIVSGASVLASLIIALAIK